MYVTYSLPIISKFNKDDCVLIKPLNLIGLIDRVLSADEHLQLAPDDVLQSL